MLDVVESYVQYSEENWCDQSDSYAPFIFAHTVRGIFAAQFPLSLFCTRRCGRPLRLISHTYSRSDAAWTGDAGSAAGVGCIARHCCAPVNDPLRDVEWAMYNDLARARPPRCVSAD